MTDNVHELREPTAIDRARNALAAAEAVADAPATNVGPLQDRAARLGQAYATVALVELLEKVHDRIAELGDIFEQYAGRDLGPRIR